MAKKQTPQSLLLANNDIVYLYWTYPQRLAGCIGFSIHRIVDGKEEQKGLMATVGFDKATDPRKSPQTTDEWPIQSFNWKDVYAPHNKKIAYRIIPMQIVNGDILQLIPDRKNSIVTKTIQRTQNYGDTQVIFNRGLLSTQAFSKGKASSDLADEKLIDGAKGLITEPGNIWRKRLGGAMLYNIKKFFKQKGRFYCCLYELSDPELIDILLKQKGVEIILSSSESNEKSRPLLHKAMKKGTLKVYDRIMKSNCIGHNKFVIHVDEKGEAKSILSGSTNWTPTGLCGQTNNMLIIHNTELANLYLDYWKQIKTDTPEGKALQSDELREWCRTNGTDFYDNKGQSTGVWFSPNTIKKTKPSVIDKEAIPIDMNEVFDCIKNAKKQIMYLVFNPGTPSVIDHIESAAKKAKQKGSPLFVRGAISDAASAAKMTTNIISKDATLPPDTYKVSGVGAIPGAFSYWEQELLKLGFATIHDKVLVIDPFDEEKCVVVTGSHNLGLKASYSNDENMLLIRGNTAIAQAYAAHVLDVVNHFKWRYKLQQKNQGKTAAAKQKALESAWHDLSESDDWMKYYYDKNGDLQREQLLF